MSLQYVKDSVSFFRASGRALKAAHKEFFNPSKTEEFPSHSGGGRVRKIVSRRNPQNKKKKSLKKKKKMSSKRVRGPSHKNKFPKKNSNTSKISHKNTSNLI